MNNMFFSLKLNKTIQNPSNQQIRLIKPIFCISEPKIAEQTKSAKLISGKKQNRPKTKKIAFKPVEKACVLKESSLANILKKRAPLFAFSTRKNLFSEKNQFIGRKATEY